MIQRLFCCKCYVVIVIITSFIAISCSQRPQYKYINPEEIKSAVHELDSLASTLYGYEPKENENLGHPGIDKPIQETYDTARVTWHSFATMINRKDYKGAYDVYNQADRKGDFMVFLKTSYMRYRFDSEVLRPLFYEYETKEKADSLYIDVLELEYLLEAYTMQLGAEKSGYIPEELPILIQELGDLQAINGNIDKSFGLVDDFAYAINGLTDNGAYANIMVALLVAGFYDSAGDREAAISTLEEYIEFTKDNMDEDRDAEEYEKYMNQARNAIQELMGR